MEEVAEALGADLVIFQTLEDLVASVRGLNPSIEKFECSVFSGEYVTGSVDNAYLDHLENIRSDNMKSKAGTGAMAASPTVADGINGHGKGEGAGEVELGKGAGGKRGMGCRAAESKAEGDGDNVRSSGAVDGVDDTIGLHNSWKLS
jgi:amidophosphoribosyltransferase